MKQKLLALLGIGALGIVLFSLPSDGVDVAFNQKFIEGNYKEPQNTILDLSNAEEVFKYVFSALEPEVIVYPTENYYYFILRANGKNIWGNMRLAPEERDKGILNFAYWEYQSISSYKKFDAGDGLLIRKISDFKYAVDYQGKEVIFTLKEVEQTPPRISNLAENEEFVQRTTDESGFGFFLIYNQESPHLMFVLDEERKVSDKLQTTDEKILVGEKSGFAFFNDAANNRKILMGVKAENMKQNNYYDGPFDQLADNYIKGTRFKEILERVYPQIKDQIDNYGRFTAYEDARMAISPYYAYLSSDWLSDIIKECRKYNAGSKFYACITHDQKEVF